MFRRAAIVVGVILVFGVVAFALRAMRADGEDTKGEPQSPVRAQTARATHLAGSVVVRNGLPQLVNPLANLMPDVFASPEEKVRALGTVADPFAAQMQAVRSGDPLLLTHAIYVTLHCSDLPVQFHGKSVRESLSQTSFDPKTGKQIPPDEELIAMYETMLSAAPVRVRIPSDLVADVKRIEESWSLGDPPDYVRRIEIHKKLAATLTPAQRATRSATIERSRDECRGRLLGNEEFGKEYRAALDRLAANGVVSALLFNRRAGWESDGLDKLTDHDYALVQRAVAEAQPDGIARLLIGGTVAVGRMDGSWASDESLGGALLLQFSLGPLTACALGVSDCGPDSSRFRSACASYGGCDQPDLASLLRHVFERDGLDPAVIDAEINRVVDAYQRRDLDALGVRRKQ